VGSFSQFSFPFASQSPAAVLGSFFLAINAQDQIRKGLWSNALALICKKWHSKRLVVREVTAIAGRGDRVREKRPPRPSIG
jgi:hypothetical protein